MSSDTIYYVAEDRKGVHGEFRGRFLKICINFAAGNCAFCCILTHWFGFDRKRHTYRKNIAEALFCLGEI